MEILKYILHCENIIVKSFKCYLTVLNYTFMKNEITKTLKLHFQDYVYDETMLRIFYEINYYWFNAYTKFSMAFEILNIFDLNQ